MTPKSTLFDYYAHCEACLACRGNLNSLCDMQYEIAAVATLLRNDEEQDFINTPFGATDPQLQLT